MKGRRQMIILSLVAALAVTTAVFYGVTYGPLSPGPRGEGERARGYTEILDEDRQVLLRTGLAVAVGDQLITAGDSMYRVIRVLGRTAVARLVSKAGSLDSTGGWAPPSQAASGPQPATEPTPSPIPAPQPAPTPVPGPGQPATPTGPRAVVVYHTHSDESYTPDDGAPVIPGNGSIFEVGATFGTALRANGYVVVGDPTRHDPHDNQAYIRSRRTAYQDIQMYNPFALFDLHRDSAPASDYLRTVADQQIQQVMIVIGRQNPTMVANLYVATQIKATADSLYPGLVKAIYMGRGLYNQDLMPTALLFEFGTETAPRGTADNAARLFADVIARAFTATTTP
ncbi:MAG TPA: stage II sporulation protein P [Bacillota bacterium]|jgi:stage II sporulation protein P